MRRAASFAARLPPRVLLPALLAVLLPLAHLSAPAFAAPPLQPFAPSLSHAVQRQAADAPRLPSSINLNAGADAVGRFTSDAPWVVGETHIFEIPNAEIGGAEPKNEPVYKSHRFGATPTSAWGYDLVVESPGLYNCTAHFAETDDASKAPGKRVFDLVFASSAVDPHIFPRVDVFADAGNAAFTVYTRTVELFPVPGVLSLRLYPLVGNAFLSALTCERAADLPADLPADYTAPPRLPAERAAVVAETVGPAAPPADADAPPEINVNCGGDSYDRFVRDDFAWLVGGATSEWGGPPNVPIGRTEPRNELAVRSHRYGMDGAPFGYRIPVPHPGIYECSLHFAETNSDAFRVGARVFDLDVMGQHVDTLDVYAATGEAGFTAHVQTFVGLELSSELRVDLTARKENAFISAITCVKTGELDNDDLVALPAADDPADADASADADDGAQADADAGAEADADAASSADPETAPPSPEPSAPSELEPSATPAAPAAATPSPGTDSEPSPGASEGGTDDSTAAASAEPTVDSAATVEPSPAEAPGATVPDGPPGGLLPPPLPSPPPRATPDEKIVPADGQLEHMFLLLVSVSGTAPQVFTDGMKDALKASLSAAAPDAAAEMAMLEATVTAETRSGATRVALSVRQDEDEADIGLPTTRAEYAVDVQMVTAADARDAAVERIDAAIADGDVADGMSERGYPNVNVGARETAGGETVDKQSESSGSNAGKIAGGVIGGGVGVLALVAVGVFVFVNRRRDSDAEEAAGFEGPPPDLSDGGDTDDMPRSETGASVEFLDDDSTFTAATSRAGEHVDHVEFVKDAFGRGTNAGTHGV